VSRLHIKSACSIGMCNSFYIGLTSTYDGRRLDRHYISNFIRIGGQYADIA
jgi:hypothetical protein